MSIVIHQKGFSAMYDIARTPVPEHLPAQQPIQASTPLGQQLVALLEMALTQDTLSRPEPPVRTKRPRGRPARLRSEQLWLALLIGVIRQAKHLSTIWRMLCLEPTGSFPVVHLTYEAVRQRLLHAGTKPLQHLFETLTLALKHWTMTHQPSALSIAAFATQVVALDETTLDQLRRLTADLRDLPKGDPHLVPGKLAGLFDLRLQRWVRVQFRADVLAGCNIGVLTLLAGLPTGSLILADLGYFSFPWFDYQSRATFGSRASRSAPPIRSKRSWPTMIATVCWMPSSGWASTGLIVLAMPSAWCSSRWETDSMAI